MIMAADMAHRFSKLVERGSPDASSKQLRELSMKVGGLQR